MTDMETIYLILLFGLQQTYCRESLFPNGPYALAMSTDGCPENFTQGWHFGYINITTMVHFNQTNSYLATCSEAYRNVSDLFYYFDSTPRSRILGNFDKKTLQLSFCYKANDTSSARHWPNGLYGVFGSKDGCPQGFSTHYISSCLPPILFYNSDGYLPYFQVEENENNAVLTFRYCRHIPDQTTDTFKGFFPFLIIQDPIIDSCPQVSGCTVTQEKYPVPMYTTLLDSNMTFVLQHCFLVSEMFEASLIEHMNYEDTDIFELTGTPFISFQVLYPDYLEYIADISAPVEMWLLLDTRQTYLISGIMYQHVFNTDEPAHYQVNGSQTNVSNIFIGDTQWDFRHGGALNCRFSLKTDYVTWRISRHAGVELYSCYKSQIGRYISMVFVSNIFIGGNRIFKDTIISIIAFETVEGQKITRCNQELGMQNYEIMDAQLTASTWIESNPPSAGRPSHAGWCAKSRDKNPFFQVDMLEMTIIDGIILRFWYTSGDSLVCYMESKSSRPKENHTFTVEFGLATNAMDLRRRKTFGYDATQSVTRPQTYLFPESERTRFLRMYFTTVEDMAPCMVLEILGCRKLYDPKKREFLTKLNEDLTFDIDVPYIPIHQEGVLSNLGYPNSYDYNTFYKWNITFSDAFVNLQFEDISLRPYKNNGFLNNGNCRDYVIVTENEVNNPFTFVKEPFQILMARYSNISHPFISSARFLLTSEDNGRLPNIRSTLSAGSPMYIGFLSCAFGDLLEIGRGFRVHVIKSELPLCMYKSTPYEQCDKDAMELASAEFLGLTDKKDIHVSFVVFSTDAFFVNVTILDFELRCKDESHFYIGLGRDDETRYCNWNIFKHKLFSVNLLKINFKKSICADPVFLQGFHIKYKVLKRIDVFPDYNLISEEISQSAFDKDYVRREVCSNNLKKCYNLEELLLSWEEGVAYCWDQGMRMVTIKDKKEYDYLQKLFIDIQLANDRYFHQSRPYDYYFRNASIPIGLYRYHDSSGFPHEHWVDGTPLTFTAWNEDQPSDTILKQCTRMIYDPSNVEKENTWETEACDTHINDTVRYLVCERSLPNTVEKPMPFLQDCYKTVASEYMGNVSNTRYGHTCQPWTHRKPNKHDFTSRRFFPDKTLRDASNYCRSPDGDHTPWCFTMDVMIAWDYCAIPKCPPDEPLTLPKDQVNLFKCESGEVMSYMVRCNNISECRDGSDEYKCFLSETCPEGQFTCTEGGRCIHLSQVCNFVADCNDASDEYCDFPACNGETEFKCENGQCIPFSQRCDSYKQCKDGSDETFCVKCNKDEAFQCPDTTCISQRLACDKYFDCIDRYDETQCNHVYETCDDVWLDGLTDDGIYLTGTAGYRTKCSFNRETGFLEMEYLNHDWERLAAHVYNINMPDLQLITDYSNLHGYVCSRQFEILPHRQEQTVKMLHNNSDVYYGEIFYKFSSNNQFSSMNGETIRRAKDKPAESRLKIHSIKCFKGLSQWPDTVFCKKGMKAEKQKRWCTRGIEKYFYKHLCFIENGCGHNRWNEKIHCSKGKSVDRKYMCLYERDVNGIMKSCRSLNHLQNCENIPCPEHYFKCPRSYCIPDMYVCNGQIECPNGEDEQICGCREDRKSNIVIMVPSSDYISMDRTIALYETALRFGGKIFTKESSIRVARIKQPYQTQISLESTEIIANSEYPNRVFDTYDVDEDGEIWRSLFGSDNLAADVINGVVWLTDVPDETDIEKYVFSTLNSPNTPRNLLKYRIATGSFVQMEFAATRETNFVDVKIRDRHILKYLGSALFPDICEGHPVACRNAYRCRLSMVCIPFVQVCDGQSHCPYGDDEDECDFTCPEGCICKPLIVSCANVRIDNVTSVIPDTTRVLDVSNTTYIGISMMSSPEQYNFRYLISLNISRCRISELNALSFRNLENLITLDISANVITRLPRNIFTYLKFLKELVMLNNHDLLVIEPGAFNGLQINSLVLQGAILERLLPDTFSGLTLETLDLSRNQIQSVDDMAFDNLITKHIYINNNPIRDFGQDMFGGVFGVEKLITPDYKFCCVRPSNLDESDCLPHRDEFSSCKNLMRNTTLQALLWVIGLLALIGNVLSIIHRMIYDKQRLKLGYGMFVTNLAISDFLMGIYMIIIAVADRIFMDRYIEVDEYWRKSGWCIMAGVISTVSSEASVLFMCLITIDRILVIKFPFGEYRFNKISIRVSVICVWVISLLIAIFPVVFENYFKGQFYSTSGVCLALPLTRNKPPGWLYSILVFVGFNLITFTLIAAGQLLIYGEVRKQAKSQRRMNVLRTNDLRVARNLLLVVSTDFMCWFPVGVIGILAMSGHPIPGEMYAWTAVLILPINSALNPFMYTLAAIIGKKAFASTILEQNMIRSMKEDATAMLLIFPHAVTSGDSIHITTCTLDSLIKRRSLRIKDVLKIIHSVVKYTQMLHGYHMILGEVSNQHIIVRLSMKSQVLRDVKIVKMPSISKKNRGQATDIEMIGVLLDTLMKSKETCI